MKLKNRIMAGLLALGISIAPVKSAESQIEKKQDPASIEAVLGASIEAVFREASFQKNFPWAGIADVPIMDFIGYQDAGFHYQEVIAQFSHLGIRPETVQEYVDGGIFDSKNIIQYEFDNGRLTTWKDVFDYYNISQPSMFSASVLEELRHNTNYDSGRIALYIINKEDKRWIFKFPPLEETPKEIKEVNCLFYSENAKDGSIKRGIPFKIVMDQGYEFMLFESGEKVPERIAKLKEKARHSGSDIYLLSGNDYALWALFGEEQFENHYSLIKGAIYSDSMWETKKIEGWLPAGAEFFETIDLFDYVGLDPGKIESYLSSGRKYSDDMIRYFSYHNRLHANVSNVVDHFGVRHIERYSANFLRALEMTMNNFDPNKPIALFIMSGEDYGDHSLSFISENLKNGEESSINNNHDGKLIYDVYASGAYNLVLFDDASTDQELVDKIKEACQKYGKISVMHMFGHGDINDFVLVASREDQHTLDLSDKDILEGIDKCFDQSSVIIIDSCASGKGGPKANNLGRMMKQATGATVYAPSGITGLCDLVTDENGLVVKPEYCEAKTVKF